MFASSASERRCSSASALPLLGSAGLDAGACEERAERRGVPLTELRFERRCSGDDMAGGCVLSLFKVAVYHFLRGVVLRKSSNRSFGCGGQQLSSAKSTRRDANA
jgi:hypothetical protein